jgi:hypothetical protein
MNTVLRARLLVLLLASILVTLTLSLVCAEKSPQKLWSIDWEPLWPRELSGVTQSCFPPTVKIAASSTVVAVGVDRSCEPGSSKGTLSPIERPHWLIVFFFDAINGKLLAIREPQLAEHRFDLYATSEGRFLLHLRNASSLGAKQLESLILVSPDGKTLKSLELQPAEGDRYPRVWKTFISPSRKTLLATQMISRTTHYKVFEGDTVAMRAEWVSPDPTEPIALSVSDKEILGLRRSRGSDNFTAPLHDNPEVLIRPFDGGWRSLLPPSNESPLRSYYAFLADDAMAILDNGKLQSGDSFARLRVVQTSGQTEGPEIIKKSSRNDVWAGAQIETSIDGHCFAVTVSSTSRFWEALDFYPSHVELYVWNRKSLQPILRIKITGFRLGFCFLPDGSRVAVLDGKSLKAYDIP